MTELGKKEQFKEIKAVWSCGKSITKPDIRSSVQKQRHISSAEKDTSEIEDVKSALESKRHSEILYFYLLQKMTSETMMVYFKK